MVFYLALFLMMLAGYLYVAEKEGNLINLIFYRFLGTGIFLVFFNCLRLFLSKEYFLLKKGDVIIIIYLVLSYGGSVLIACTETNTHFFRWCSFHKSKNLSKNVVFFVLFLFGGYWLLNYKVLLQAITNPRIFYANTRLGGGLIYYIILPLGLLLYLYFLSRIDFVKSKNIFKGAAITIVFGAIFYLFGQKAKIVTIGVLFLSMYAIRRRRPDVNIKLIKYGILLVCVMLVVFALYFVQQNISVSNIFVSMANYSDYINNFNELVECLDHFYFGSIFQEDEFYSYIPRALWPSKPELFGSLKLGLLIPRLYEWTMAKTGAPSFGPIGAAYADFGIIGVFFQLLLDWAFIIMAKQYYNQLKREDYNFFVHLSFLTFVGYPLFALTLTKFPVYQVVVTYALYYCSRFRIVLVTKWRKRE